MLAAWQCFCFVLCISLLFYLCPICIIFNFMSHFKSLFDFSWNASVMHIVVVTVPVPTAREHANPKSQGHIAISHYAPKLCGSGTRTDHTRMASLFCVWTWETPRTEAGVIWRCACGISCCWSQLFSAWLSPCDLSQQIGLP